MARVKLELPEKLGFSTDIEVHVGYINYGNHVGNDSMLTLIQEARMRFLKSMGYTELAIEGRGIVLADAAVQYKSEAFHGEVLTIDVGVADFNKYGCDIFYRVYKKATADGPAREVAHAKTGIVFFDYSVRRPVEVPPAFLARFPRAQHGAT